MSDVKIKVINEYDDIISKFKENKPVSLICEEIVTPMSCYRKIIMSYKDYRLSYMLNRQDIIKSKLELKEIINYILDYMWSRMRKELHLWLEEQ